MLLSALLCITSQAAVITLDVDATQVTRNMLHAHESIPVRGGAVTLVYPKWIPGEHGPYGPLNEIVNLHFRANGQELSWRRDDVEMFEFRVNTAGANVVNLDFDQLWQPEDTSTLHLA